MVLGVPPEDLLLSRTPPPRTNYIEAPLSATLDSLKLAHGRIAMKDCSIDGGVIRVDVVPGGDKREERGRSGSQDRGQEAIQVNSSMSTQ